MAEIITGKACADVTGELYNRIFQTVSEGQEAMIIVPDQFVFETERALFRKCSAQGRTELFQQIRVRTIARISDEIVTRYSTEKPPADDITKSVIMYRAARSRDVELNSLGRVSRKPGFAPGMVKTVSLFKTAGIDCARLSERLGEDTPPVESPALLAKLRDISALYTEYDQILSANYTDKLDVTMRAADLAMRYGWFNGKHVFVDGFNSFSGSQLMLLRSAAERAEYACFAFVCDKNDKRDLFRTILADIDRLSGEDGIPEPLQENSRGMVEGIIRASDLLWSSTPDAETDMSSVRVIRADDAYSEMDFIAAEIKRLISEEGYRYSEIAVLCSSPKDHRSPAESAFAKYDIPVFCDIPESILNTPLTNLILSLLKAIDEPNAENLLSYVRSSFLRIKDEDGKFRALSLADIDSFDGYIFRWQIHGDQLQQEFTTDKMGRDDQAQAERAESVRESAVVPVILLRDEIIEKKRAGECTGAWLSERICSFLFTETGIEQAVLSAEESCTALWDILVGIFEAIHSALGNEEITPGDYYSLFRDICAEAELAKPPQLVDCVILGDTGRTRADNIKVAFIAGACYGMFPEESSGCGLFSDYEAELLGESDIKISMKQEERYHYNRYQAYRAMTLATDRLYLTYPVLSTACDTLTRSDVISDLLELFPQIREEYAGNGAEFGDDFYCRTKYSLRARYASLFGDNDAGRRSTLRRALELSGDGEYAQKLERLVLERPSAYRHRLSPDTAGKLFRANRVSATKLEGLNKCRFEYFCRFGLKIRERRTLNAANSEVGSAVHYVLEKTLSEYCTKMHEFFRLDREQLTAKSAELLRQYADKNMGGSGNRTRAFNYMYEGLAVSCADLLIVLQKEFSSRDYRPVLFELQFQDGNVAELPNINEETDGEQMTLDDLSGHSEPLPLNTKQLSVPPLRIKVNDRVTVAITGIVDRADMFRSEGGNEYIRIVDYKTGGHAFKLSNALYGVNTQMLIYLIALCDANPQVTPGGVSYLTARMTDASSTPAGLLALLTKGHYPSGMCVKDDDTKFEMEKFAERYASMILNSGDEISKKKLNPREDAQPTPAQFRKLRDEILEQTRGVLRKIYSGDVQAIPTIYTEEGKSGQQKSCQYCRYKGVCGNQDSHGVIVDDGITERKLGTVGIDEEPQEAAPVPSSEEKPAVPEKPKRRTRKKPADDQDGFIGSLT